MKPGKPPLGLARIRAQGALPPTHHSQEPEVRRPKGGRPPWGSVGRDIQFGTLADCLPSVGARFAVAGQVRCSPANVLSEGSDGANDNPLFFAVCQTARNTLPPSTTATRRSPNGVPPRFCISEIFSDKAKRWFVRMLSAIEVRPKIRADRIPAAAVKVDVSAANFGAGRPLMAPLYSLCPWARLVAELKRTQFDRGLAPDFDP